MAKTGDQKIKLDKKPYKGTRDFYPPEMRAREKAFDLLRRVAESFGYEPYEGPMLEAFDLYAAKTGEEIVRKQLYHFQDQGDRHVAIRPEMTPTLARMVAARQRELPRPVRLYSLPNLWRYEQPGRGRLREHWQFNVDVLGADSLASEVEILSLAMELLLVFAPPENSFSLRLSHRAVLNELTEKLGLDGEAGYRFAKVLDKKEKIKADEFEALLSDEVGLDEGARTLVNRFLSADSLTGLRAEFPENTGLARLEELSSSLTELGYGEWLRVDPSIVRGFDYYTGTIFEIHDNHPENNRSLFGGGRYDNLVGLFGGESLSGFGFGMGDVTLENFLRIRELWPKVPKPVDLFLVLFSEEMVLPTQKLAADLRRQGLNVETALKADKLGKQFKNADNRGARFVGVLGPDELAAGKLVIKDLSAGSQESVGVNEIALHVRLEK